MRGPAFAAAFLIALASGAGAQAPEPTPLPEESAPGIPTRPSAEEELTVLMEALRDPDSGNPEMIEQRIIELWSRSGSPTADLLLERGREAIQAENYREAIGHLTALTDHAPDFAEGWNTRATVFFMIEEFGLAMTDIERTLALNPDHFGALAGLGIILDQTDRPEAALAAFRAARMINPHRERVNDAIRRLAPMVDGRDL